VTNLALGTVQFGTSYGVSNKSGQTPFNEVKKILALAKENDINILDTAIAYGDSEAVLGKSGAEDFKIISKLPEVPDDCQDIAHWVNNEIHKSLERLGVKRLYGVLLHRPAQLLEPIGFALYDALQGIKEQGISLKIGVSIYEPVELDALFDIYSLDIVQAPLNILDRTLVESGWASRLHTAGVEVHARSVFLQGLLLLPPEERPNKFNRWNNVWRVWDGWLEQEGLSPLQACLRYVAHLSQIDAVVVGSNTAAQLIQIIEAVEGELHTLPEFPRLKDKRLFNPASWYQL